MLMKCVRNAHEVLVYEVLSAGTGRTAVPKIINLVEISELGVELACYNLLRGHRGPR